MFILNLHGIGSTRRQVPASEQRVWLEPECFAAILDYVQTRPDVVLTFDDANESDYTVALPALRARGLKARFFLVADRIGQPGFLSPGQVEGLLGSGMQLGSHGLRHRPWAGLEPAALQEELVEARGRLERLTGLKIDQASCPFGSYNRSVLSALRHHGYESVYTSDGGPVRPGSWLQPRNGVYRAHSLEVIRRMLSDKGGLATRWWRSLKLTIKRWR